MENNKKAESGIRIQLSSTHNKGSMIQKPRTEIDTVSKATLLTYIQS